MKMRNLFIGVILGLLAVVHSTPLTNVTQDDVYREVVTDGYLIDHHLLLSPETQSPERNTTAPAPPQPSPVFMESDIIEGSGDASDQMLTSTFPGHGRKHFPTMVEKVFHPQRSTVKMLPMDTDESGSGDLHMIRDEQNLPNYTLTYKAVSSTFPTTTLSPASTTTLSPASTTTLSPASTTTLSPASTTTLSPASTTTLSPASTTTLSPASTTTPSPASTTTPSPASTTTPSPASTTTLSPASTTTLSPASTTTLSPASTTTPSPASTTTPSPASTTTPSPASTTILSPASTTTLSPASTTTPSPASTTTPIRVTPGMRHEKNGSGSERESRSGIDRKLGDNNKVTNVEKITDEGEKSKVSKSSSGWIMIVGFIAGVAALLTLCIAIATRHKCNKPKQETQPETQSDPPKELEMETFLNKDQTTENGRTGEYTVIPLEDLPQKNSPY